MTSGEWRVAHLPYNATILQSYIPQTMKNLIILLTAVLVCAALGLFLWLQSSAPTYEGSLSISGLQKPVTIHFDDFGVPHIEAENNKTHVGIMAFTLARAYPCDQPAEQFLGVVDVRENGRYHQQTQ